MSENPSLPELRAQINRAFDDVELDAFCLDHFPQVYEKFSRGLRRDEKINILLADCQRKDELERLAHLLDESIKPAPTSTPDARDKQEHRLYGSRVIQVAISQMFQIEDFLTHPEEVKARELYEAVTDASKMRRVLNRGSTFELEGLGRLKPVVTTTEKYERFWTAAIPDLRNVYANECPLCFMPYELALSDRLHDRQVHIRSLGEMQSQIQNLQRSARLRIYPPGTGVIRLAITLTFTEFINIDAVTKLALEIEELFFIDPTGEKKPYEDFFLEVIEAVNNALFMEKTGEGEEIIEGQPFSAAWRRWEPPTTEYSLRGETTLDPEAELQSLTRLLGQAPGNRERLCEIKRHIQSAVEDPQWRKNGILAAAAEGSALFIVAKIALGRSKRKKLQILRWLSETHELITAAIYAEKALAQELKERCTQLNDAWLPKKKFALWRIVSAKADREKPSKFMNLHTLLQTLLKVKQATASIRFHLHKQGGSMMAFAEELWQREPIDQASLVATLDAIDAWLQNAQETRADERIGELQGIIERIKQIRPPFS